MLRTARLQLELAYVGITGVLAEINALTLELQCRVIKDG